MDKFYNKTDHIVKLKMDIAVIMIMVQIVNKMQVICAAQVI